MSFKESVVIRHSSCLYSSSLKKVTNVLNLKATEVCVSSARFRKCVRNKTLQVHVPSLCPPPHSLHHRESFLQLYSKKPFSSLSVPLFLLRQFGEVGDDFGVAIFMAGFILAGPELWLQTQAWERGQGLPELPLAREVQKDTECQERGHGKPSAIPGRGMLAPTFEMRECTK